MKILGVGAGTATSDPSGLTEFGLVGVFTSLKNQQLAGHFRNEFKLQASENGGPK
jgi:hypothetical protein